MAMQIDWKLDKRKKNVVNNFNIIISNFNLDDIVL